MALITPLNASDLFGFDTEQQEALFKIFGYVEAASQAGAPSVNITSTEFFGFDSEQQEVLRYYIAWAYGTIEYMPGYLLNAAFNTVQQQVLFKIFTKLRESGLWNPMRLFQNNEQGMWYDFGDLNTLYQDSAGTTPVTAVEQPVGLVLDKRLGAVRGPDIAVNGTFNTDLSGWVDQSTAPGTVVWEFGKARLTRIDANNARLDQQIPTVAGVTYEVTVDIGDGTLQVQVGSTGGGSGLLPSTSLGIGSRRFVFTAISATSFMRFFTFGIGTGTIDNVTIRSIMGNHVIQPTAAARPVLSARSNRLPCSDLSTAVVGVLGAGGALPTGWQWNANAGLTKEVVAKGTLPDGSAYIDVRVSGTNTSGGISSDLYLTNLTTISITAGGQAVASIRGEVIAGSNVGFNHPNGRRISIGGFNGGAFVEGNNGVTYLDDINLRREVSRTMISATITNARAYVEIAVPNGNTVDLTLRIAQPQLEYGLVATRFQRVTTATDYDSVGFPLYLRFDGTDDGLTSIANIDFTGTDKSTEFAGVTKLSDAAIGIIVESNDGTLPSFALQGPNSGTVGNFAARSGGTSSTSAVSNPVFIAPIAAVVTGLSDIAGDLTTLRINGVQAAQAVADQGTGNYGSVPIRVGARSGSNRFNGQINQIVILGRTATTDEVGTTEKFIASKTGVTI